MKRSFGGWAFDTLNHLVLILLAASIIYPFWTTLLLSFSPMSESNSLGFKLWINEWSTGAYKFAFSTYGNMGVAYVNSIYRTVLGTTLAVIFALAAAYPLSKRNLPGRTFLTIIILITMFFSGGMITSYLLIRTLGLMNTRMALILPNLAIGFHIIIMRNFLMTIDDAYEESALLEGANYVQILLRIIVPLSKPVIATIALWSAVFHWNEWFQAMMYLTGDDKIVLQRLLRKMIHEMEAILSGDMANFELLNDLELPTAALQAAMTLLTIGPIFLLYPFLQRYFIKGIFVGSLKG
ncbi:MAG: carbohydrate ABC transporter permease [Spirochaetales bacterium]|nr:carbohydrate ABC transporter permease [Spirochaetales bacterium]